MSVPTRIAFLVLVLLVAFLASARDTRAEEPKPVVVPRLPCACEYRQ